MSNVFIAFQANEESRPVVEAILADNLHAVAVESPGMVKIDAPGQRSLPMRSRGDVRNDAVLNVAAGDPHAFDDPLMRPILVRLHRWFGIGTVLFLFVSGLTGAIIAWNQELDAALNPEFYYARFNAPALSPLDIANRIEAADPRLHVTYLPLAVEPGRTLQICVQGRLDPATREPYGPGFNQLAVDPGTGAIQARREWGALSVERLDLLPYVDQLHDTLYLPTTANGVAIGVWLLGSVAIVWLFDSVIALTSISMNLEQPVVRPVVSFFSTLAPTPESNPESGRQVGGSIPGRGTAGDLFLQAQFPLHSGRIPGLPGRIVISVMGLMVALLSATGLVIWFRKLSARRSPNRPGARCNTVAPVRASRGSMRVVWTSAKRGVNLSALRKRLSRAALLLAARTRGMSRRLHATGRWPANARKGTPT